MTSVTLYILMAARATGPSGSSDWSMCRFDSNSAPVVVAILTSFSPLHQAHAQSFSLGDPTMTTRGTGSSPSWQCIPGMRTQKENGTWKFTTSLRQNLPLQMTRCQDWGLPWMLPAQTPRATWRNGAWSSTALQENGMEEVFSQGRRQSVHTKPQRKWHRESSGTKPRRPGTFTSNEPAWQSASTASGPRRRTRSLMKQSADLQPSWAICWWKRKHVSMSNEFWQKSTPPSQRNLKDTSLPGRAVQATSLVFWTKRMSIFWKKLCRVWKTFSVKVKRQSQPPSQKMWRKTLHSSNKSKHGTLTGTSKSQKEHYSTCWGIWEILELGVANGKKVDERSVYQYSREV